MSILVKKEKKAKQQNELSTQIEHIWEKLKQLTIEVDELKSQNDMTFSKESNEQLLKLKAAQEKNSQKINSIIINNDLNMKLDNKISFEVIQKINIMENKIKDILLKQKSFEEKYENLCSSINKLNENNKIINNNAQKIATQINLNTSNINEMLKKSKKGNINKNVKYVNDREQNEERTKEKIKECDNNNIHNQISNYNENEKFKWVVEEMKKLKEKQERINKEIKADIDQLYIKFTESFKEIQELTWSNFKIIQDNFASVRPLFEKVVPQHGEEIEKIKERIEKVLILNKEEINALKENLIEEFNKKIQN